MGGIIFREGEIVNIRGGFHSTNTSTPTY